MSVTDKSREPLQNEVARTVGSNKVWGTILVDGDGNAVLVDSLSWEIRWDYASRTDGQATYVGYAPSGTATSTEAWLIHKFTFDANGYVTRRQVATDVAWTARTTSF